MADFESIASIVSTLVALILVLLLAWFLLKWMGKYSGPQAIGSRHIKILDRVMVSQDKCLVLVRVAEKTMLIGMSQGAVSKLCDLDDPEGLLDLPESQTQNFSALFQSMVTKHKARGGEEEGK